MNTADFTLAEPAKAGDALGNASVDSKAGYTASTAWTPDGTTAKASTTYTATVTLTAKTGESFENPVSGPDGWEFDSTNSDSTKAIFTKSFTTSAKATKEATWNNQDGDVVFVNSTYDGSPVDDVTAQNVKGVANNKTTNPAEMVKDIPDEREKEPSFRFYTDNNDDFWTVLSAAPTDAGSYKITVVYETATTIYETSKLDFKINPKPVTATVTAANKAFDGNKTATVSATVGTGITGEALKISGLTGEFSDANVGNGKTVTVNSTSKVISAADNAPSTKPDNYEVTIPNTTTANITAATMSGVTANGYTGIYDGKAYGITVTAAGATIKYGKTEGTYNLTESPTYTDVGEYTVYYQVEMANYNTVTGSETVKIKPKALTVSGVTPSATVTKVYDGDTTVDQTFTLTLTGVVSGEEVTASAAGAAYDSKTVGTNKTVTLSGITLSGDTKDNYTVAETKTTTGAITAKSVTITGLGAEDKTYDGTMTATVTGTAEVSGKVGSDDVVADVSNGSAAFVDAYAGSGKDVTFSGYSLSGTDKGNYTLSGQPASVTANINAATQPLSCTNSSITKGTSKNLSTCITNKVDSAEPAFSLAESKEGVTLSGSTLSVAADVAEDTQIVVNVNSAAIDLNGDSVPEYAAATQVNMTLTVVKKQSATVNITGAPTSAKTYGNGTFKLGVTCNPTGLPCNWSSSNKDVLTVSDTGIVTIVGAGTADITATCENDSYLGSATVAITVNKANLSYSKTPGAKTGLVYTGSPLTLVNEGSVTGGTVQYKLGGGEYGTTLPSATAAGTYTVYYKAVANNSTNYNDIAEQSFTVTIGKANPTYTAPTAKTLSYTNAAQDLINGGVTAHGTFSYSLNGNDYAAAIPQGTNAGTYTVYYKLTGDENHKDVAAKTVTVTISKAAAPAAPGVTGGDCTTHEQNNGKISDVTADMEYKLSTASVWTKCTGTEITGLVPGTYNVRVAETTTAEAGAVKTVIIVKHTCVFDAYTPNNNATCQQNDTETQHCTSVECTATGDTREIANSTTAHDYVNGVCKNCQAVNPVGTTLSKAAITNEADVAALVSADGPIMLADGKNAHQLYEAIQSDKLTTKNEVKTATPDANKKSKFNEKVDADSSIKNAKVVDYLDISVALVANGNEVLGSINETDQPVTFQIKLADTLLADLEGKSVFVLREHGGVITKLAATLSADGILTFSSDEFSTYAIVAYEPVSGGSHHGGSYNPGHTVTSDLGNVTRVTVDGKVVDSKYYTVSGGNVVLSGEFMKTLTNGKHTVKLYNGSIAATGVITVTGNTVQAPRTGDAGAVLYGVMAISSVLGMGWVAKKKRCEK